MDIVWNKNTMASQMKAGIGVGIKRGFKFINDNFDALIVFPLIIGGKGWRGYMDTASWKWLNSPQGWAQLGFTQTTEPFKLIVAMKRSWSCRAFGAPKAVAKNNAIGIEFKLWSLSELLTATQHPAAGKLNMPANRSWFEWIYKGMAVAEPASFQKTGPMPAVRSSKIAGGFAGRMTTKDGAGFWQVPPKFRADFDKLLDQNRKKIENTIRDNLVRSINASLKGSP